MQELQITMLGPRGVGKTTLLTAMYEQFEKNIGVTDLQLSPDEESSVILQDKRTDLESLLDVFEAKGNTKGIKGDDPAGSIEDLKAFKFDLGQKGGKASLRLIFRDYPGAYVIRSPETISFVKKLLIESHAVLVAIDSPALMEEHGRYHQKINRPQQITDFIKDSYKELKEPRLVIFAPVKCEKYLRKEDSKIKFINSIQSNYSNLITHLQSPGLREKVAVVITPVQTVGSVIVSRIDPPDEAGGPHFYFRKLRHDSKYSPKDSEQPLRYLLRFLLKLHIDNRSWGKFDFLRDWLGKDEHLKQAIAEFAGGCKTTNGFKIIQGESLLHL
jgi:hypothetical protein